METLLIYFALPIATIIISIILQKILNCPLLVASFVFAVFLIVTFAVFDETFLIATLAYTILSLLTAVIVKLFCNCVDNDDDNNSCLCDTITNSNNNENSGCGCNRYSYRRRF